MRYQNSLTYQADSLFNNLIINIAQQITESVDKLSFREFVDLVNPQFVWYQHCQVLADILQQVADGKIKRLMIFAPPRHGKSEITSRLFSAYYLFCYPHHWVGLSSYGANLSYSFSRYAREYFVRGGGQIKRDAAGVEQWQTLENGGLWAAGVGGPISGKGFHLGIIDDPIKNFEEALSETYRTRQKDWYDSTFYTRIEPNASIILIQTRWHEDDLAGYLLSKEQNEPEHWHIISLEAIYSGEQSNFPATCKVIPDWREVGQALCPERYDEDQLRKIMKRIGPHWSAALYDQRPVPRSGNMVDRSQIEIVDQLPDNIIRLIRYWDTAASTGEGSSYTSGILMGVSKDGYYYVIDVVRGRWDPATRDKIILQTAQLDEQRFGRGKIEIWREQEPGGSGKEVAQNFIRLMAGYPVKVDRVTGSKVTRFDPFASQAGAGFVKIVAGPWNQEYLNEISLFPFSRYNDMADATSGAFNKLSGKRSLKISFG